MKNLLIAFILCLGISASAQHRVGVRAGLNFSKFTGPLEVGESYNTSGGFHFGINYTYELNDKFGIRGELLYTQRGTGQTYKDSSSYYFVNPIVGTTFLTEGYVDMTLEISTATISLPVTANYRLSRKFEIFGGASLDFVVGPSGSGRVQFIDPLDANLNFTQSFDHNYNSDVPGQFNTFIPTNLLVNLNGDIVTLPRIIGAYYNFPALGVDEEMTSRIRGFDAYLIAGTNYYINSGFYIGARIEFGLIDTTNDSVDKSLKSLDDTNNFIFRDDTDKSIGVAFSFGFKF